MCLILFGYRIDANRPLIVAANRDEFHGRAATQANFWPDNDNVLAGRDEVAGGRDDAGPGLVVHPEPGEVQDAVLVPPDRSSTSSSFHLESTGAQHKSRLQNKKAPVGADLHGPDHGELSQLHPQRGQSLFRI